MENKDKDIKIYCKECGFICEKNICPQCGLDQEYESYSKLDLELKKIIEIISTRIINLEHIMSSAKGLKSMYKIEMFEDETGYEILSRLKLLLNLDTDNIKLS